MKSMQGKRKDKERKRERKDQKQKSQSEHDVTYWKWYEMLNSEGVNKLSAGL